MRGDVINVEVDGVECGWWQTQKEVRKDGATPTLNVDAQNSESIRRRNSP